MISDQSLLLSTIVLNDYRTGVVSCCQQVFLKKLPCYSNSLFQQLQQAALLGTISILRDKNFVVVLPGA